MHSQEGEVPQAILQAWGLAESASRGPAARFTIDHVVAVALEVADTEGIEKVTLSGVAQRMGVVTTALYRYVDSKATLDELVRDAALGPAPDLGGCCVAEATERWCDALWDRYLAHRWLAATAPPRAPRCPNAYEWLDALVSPLEDQRVEDPAGLVVTLDTLVRGFALQAAVQGTDAGGVVRDEITRRHPRLATAAARGIDPHQLLIDSVRKLTL